MKLFFKIIFIAILMVSTPMSFAQEGGFGGGGFGGGGAGNSEGWGNESGNGNNNGSGNTNSTNNENQSSNQPGDNEEGGIGQPDANDDVGSGSPDEPDNGYITVDLSLENPLEGSGVNNILDFVERIVQLAIKIGIPIAAMFIIIAGLMYVTAQGNEAQIKKAHAMFKNVLIATILLFAAWAIAMGIQGALEDILS